MDQHPRFAARALEPAFIRAAIADDLYQEMDVAKVFGFLKGYISIGDSSPLGRWWIKSK